MIIFVSGLPGSGKSTVGSLVAEKLDWSFVEADEYLSEETKKQIKAGELLSQEQLDDWIIKKLIPNVIEQEKEGPLVVAGMLAEKRFVAKLSHEGNEVLFINLNVPYEVLEKRVGERDHFAKKEMLDKCWQFKEKFVLPGPTIDATHSPSSIVEEIISKVRV